MSGRRLNSLTPISAQSFSAKTARVCQKSAAPRWMDKLALSDEAAARRGSNSRRSSQ